MATPTSPPPGRGKRRRAVPMIWLGSLAAVVAIALGVTGAISGFTAEIDNTGNTAGAGTLLMTETGISGVTSTGSCYSNGTATGSVGSGDASNCTIINKFGATTLLTPNTALSGTAPNGVIPVTSPATDETNQNTGLVSITNSGADAAHALTLNGIAPGCVAASAPVPPFGSSANLCPVLDVAVYESTAATAPTPGTASTYGTQIFYGTATALGNTSTSPINVTGAALAAGAKVYMTFVVWVDSGADNSYQGLNANVPLAWKFS